MYQRGGKRCFDLAIAVMTLFLLIPLLLSTVVAIGLFDSGPILFIQDRVGRNGVIFRFLKFRSMPIGTGDIPSDVLKEIKLTWIGKFIRRSSIDELPQLLNIMRGNMSIVGPRPSISSQIELCELRRINGALACRPGLTGLAQIRSFDGMSFSEKAELDGQYARHVTFAGDIGIILRTFTYLTKPPPKY